MDHHGSGLRRLSAEDFSADQVADWMDAAGGKSEDAGPSNPAEPDEWLVAYTDPRRERDVAEAVKRRAFASYVPVMTVTRRRRDVAKPLLPRYVFIGLGADQSLFGLRETPGLEGLVKVGGLAVAVKPAIVDGLRAQEASGVYDFTAERMERAQAEMQARAWEDKLKAFVPGTKVMMVRGPWRWFKGSVTDGLPPDRISVVIRIVGREHVVPMMLDDVERAP